MRYSRFFSIAIIFFFSILNAPFVFAGLVVSLSPSDNGATSVYIRGSGTVNENLGAVINFFNVEGGDAFSSELEDLEFILPDVHFGNDVFITSLVLDHDKGGDDFFLRLSQSVDVGFQYDIDELFILPDLKYEWLYPGKFHDMTDPESISLGGFSLFINPPNIVHYSVSAPHLSFLSFTAVISLSMLFRRRKNIFVRKNKV